MNLAFIKQLGIFVVVVIIIAIAVSIFLNKWVDQSDKNKAEIYHTLDNTNNPLMVEDPDTGDVVYNGFSQYFMMGGVAGKYCKPNNEGIVKCDGDEELFSSKYRIQNKGIGGDGLYMIQNLDEGNKKWCQTNDNNVMKCDIKTVDEAQLNDKAAFGLNYIGEFIPSEENNQICDSAGKCRDVTGELSLSEIYFSTSIAHLNKKQAQANEEAYDEAVAEQELSGAPILGESVHLYKWNIKQGGVRYCKDGSPLTCNDPSPNDTSNVFALIHYDADDT